METEATQRQCMMACNSVDARSGIGDHAGVPASIAEAEGATNKPPHRKVLWTASLAPRSRVGMSFGRTAATRLQTIAGAAAHGVGVGVTPMRPR